MQEYCNDFVVIPEAETQTIIIAPTIDGAALKLSVKKAQLLAEIILHQIQSL